MNRIPFFNAFLLVPAVCLAAGETAAPPAPAPGAPSAPALSPEQSAFFEAKIRPVLAGKCYDCHSAATGKAKGGLTLDTRAGWQKGGADGPAIVPFKPDASPLITAIRYHDADLAMPPQKAGGKLDAAVIADFEKWVTMGAPDPRTGAALPGAVAIPARDMTEARQWWAFQPVRSAAAPAAESDWAKNDIDRFILAGLQSKGLAPGPDAEPLVLLRRVHFDLTGLPPTPEETAAFSAAWAAGNPDAVLAAEVDRLLASPQFGERWGRHWLDVARYAESSGKDMNLTYPQAWRYRDYVLAAFNADMPFDRFLKEQVAGDLLPAKTDADRARQLVATGFLALGAKSINEMKPKQFALDLADEQVDTLSQAALGLTVSCARCHDHKFDPVSQRDYTALAGIFLSTNTQYGTPGGVIGRNAGTLCALPPGTGAVIAAPMDAATLKRKQAKLADLSEQKRAILAARRAGGSPNAPAGKPGAAGGKPTDGLTNFDVARVLTQVSQLEAELANYNADGSPKALAMGLSDKPASLPQGRGPGGRLGGGPGGAGGRMRTGFETIADSPLFTRGDMERAGETVPRGIPALFPGMAAVKAPAGTSGRLELAAWLTSRDNPLTARVMTNRIWMWLMGRGLVASPDNFGTTGAKPSHPELLDTLAARFIDSGWSVKKMVRQIVLSRAYRQSAAFDDAKFTLDPENTLLWRHNPRRLDAEEIRDGMLQAAGALDLKPRAGSLIGRSGDGPIGGDRLKVFTEEELGKTEADTRSVYLPLARNAAPEILSVFDYPESVSVQSARQSTNVPAQSLFMLNSDFCAKQAARVAVRILTAHPGAAGASLEERFNLACRLILGRTPRASELAAVRPLVAHHADNALEAWTAVARGLFATAEFRHLD